jgi:MFS family permease
MVCDKNRIFPGWYVLSSSFAILFLVQGSRGIIGLTLKPIAEEFGWTRSAVSLVVFLHMTVFALVLTLIGKCYDRYGARRVIFLSSLLLGAGFIGLTRVDTFAGFVFFYGVIAAVGLGGPSVPLIAALVSNWFETNRGGVVSLALAGGCVGHFLVVLLSNHLVVGYDWRWAYIVSGILILVVSAAAVGRFIYNRPADIGLLPYRSKNRPPASEVTVENEAASDLNLLQSMRTRSFWMYAVIMAVCGGGDYLIVTHMVAMATDLGIAQATAGNMLAWFGLASLAGILAAGWAIDRIGHKVPIVITFLVRCILCVMMLRAQDVYAFYLFALIIGFTYLITAPMTTTLVIQLYGFSHVGAITGVITTVHHLSGGLWAWLGGFAFDRTGSYHAVLAAYAGASLLAAICAIFIQEKKAGRAGALDYSS